jgi:DHA1 family multidrug resistance protein-like MFS transporter
VKLKMWVGLINSSAAITLAIFAPIWGHLADTFSRRAMLLRAMFGGAVIISLTTLVNAPWQLLVLKAIQGCLTGTVAAATVITASITPAAQVAFALGMLQTMIAVGNSLGPLVGGVLADFIGYRAAFFSTGIVLVMSGIVVLKGLDNDTRPVSEKSAKKLTLIPDIRPIKASPLLITLLVVSFGVQSANTVATPMLPLFLKSLIRNLSAEPAYIGSSTGVVLGVGAAFAAMAAVLVGKLSSRIGYWKTLMICLSAGAALTVPQTFVTKMYQLVVLRALSSFFIGGTAPVINAIIAVSSDKTHQGTVFGVNSSVSSAGNALGPIIGSAAAMLSYRAVFLTSALILAVSAWITSSRRRKLSNS